MEQHGVLWNITEYLFHQTVNTDEGLDKHLGEVLDIWPKNGVFPNLEKRVVVRSRTEYGLVTGVGIWAGGWY